MVNKNQSKVSTLRSKLVAAIAMLLVGAFMVVSSSYAWFTLSTAPEVTGIYTSVGANGNLEMALVPEGGVASIESPVGSTGKNETWGNLVDLGQTEGNQNKYGLDKISLVPARLETTAGTAGNTYAFNGLKSVTYGADGRPADWKNAVAGKYKDGSFEKMADDADTYGVTAYGAASGMSAQQNAYLQYRKEMDALLSAAQAKADATFETYGNAIADVVMAKAMQGDSAKYNIAFAPAMIDALELANQDLIDAVEKYVAVAASMALYNADDATWTGAVAKLAALDLSNSTTIADSETTLDVDGIEITLTPALRKAINKYVDIKGKLAAAETAITESHLEFEDTTDTDGTVTAEATAKTATWTQANAILFITGVINYNEILVNNTTVDGIKDLMKYTDENGDEHTWTPGSDADIPDALMDFGLAFVQNGEIAFTSGSGVHADIADIAGEYQATIGVTVEFDGMSLKNDKVVLRTKVDSGSAIDMTAGLSTPNDNDNSGTKKLLTEFYGYQLDFAFRTNAQTSKLQLQTNPADRIYSDGGNGQTMGNGSTMSFKALNANFTEAQVKALMATVRIVFMDGAGNIIGLGLLSQDGAGVTKDAGDNYVSNIYLWDFTIDGNGKLVVTAGSQKGADTGVAELMDLNQNVATEVSVLVYMDGDIVDNSMVAADATASLQGSLNLQFSSSAELKPMDYAEFKGTASND